LTRLTRLLYNLRMADFDNRDRWLVGPGDVLFLRTKDKPGGLIRFWQWLTDRGDYYPVNHVVVHVGRYCPGCEHEYVVSAEPPRVRVRRLWDMLLDACGAVYVAHAVNPATALAVARCAVRNVGRWYDFVGVLGHVVYKLWGKYPELKFAKYCSELASECAGVRPTRQTPASLAVALSVLPDWRLGFLRDDNGTLFCDVEGISLSRVLRDIGGVAV